MHFFVVPSPGNLVGKINWRINKPEGDFIERSTTQVCNVFSGGYAVIGLKVTDLVLSCGMRAASWPQQKAICHSTHRVQVDAYPLCAGCIKHSHQHALNIGRTLVQSLSPALSIRPAVRWCPCAANTRGRHAPAAASAGTIGMLVPRVLTSAPPMLGMHLQSFKQDPNNVAMLYNHGNEYLHYQDDWYILASKPNEYIMIYYRGTNDAWCVHDPQGSGYCIA